MFCADLLNPMRALAVFSISHSLPTRIRHKSWLLGSSSSIIKANPVARPALILRTTTAGQQW
jgi:hypothetical protein